MRKLTKLWRAAKADPEQGQLSDRYWWPGKTSPAVYDGYHFQQGWWLDPNRFAIGISFDRVDWLPGGYDGRTGITVHLGPLLFVIDLCQPLRPLIKHGARR